jgi:hypothetical protein
MIKAMIPSNTSHVNQFIQSQFGFTMHKKRMSSLSDAVVGLLTNQCLQPTKIGHGLAEAKGLLPKHTVKQVDRLLSNQEIDPEFYQNVLAQMLISHRKKILVAMDWTVFAKDRQMTLTLRLITSHGRATPLLWKTVSSVGLKGNKNHYVFLLFEQLRRLVSREVQVIILADREFGTLNNMEKLKAELGFDYILRLKRNFTLSNKSKTVKKLAYEWLANEATCIDDGYATTQEYPVKKIIVCKESGMKDMWVLACSISNIATQTILNYYGKRWGTECSYRDEKDLRFGFGLKTAKISSIQRRDRLLLISAIAIIFLTLLGAASEAIGFDKYIKANTSKKRTHSLYTQGKILLNLVKNMKNWWLEQIIEAMRHLMLSMAVITDDQYFI